jgi:hypothetical protein
MVLSLRKPFARLCGFCGMEANTDTDTEKLFHATGLTRNAWGVLMQLGAPMVLHRTRCALFTSVLMCMCTMCEFPAVHLNAPEAACGGLAACAQHGHWPAS